MRLFYVMNLIDDDYVNEIENFGFSVNFIPNSQMVWNFKNNSLKFGALK